MTNIPKIIHYCWFGRGKLPKLALKCINSWKEFLPNYEIRIWTEDNFDINCIRYVKEAYDAKRYAFVSDYARFWILYNYGGVYLDTDVMIIKSIDDILERGSFMGCETYANNDSPLFVNPGLGMATEPGNPLLKEMLDLYANLHFINPDGTHNIKSIVRYTSEALVAKGLKQTTDIQKIASIWIYPKEYFNPYDYNKNKILITPQTRSIHYFAGSWITKKERIMKFIEKYLGERPLIFLHNIKHHVLK